MRDGCSMMGSSDGLLGPVSRKSRQLFGPGKLFYRPEIEGSVGFES